MNLNYSNLIIEIDQNERIISLFFYILNQTHDQNWNLFYSIYQPNLFNNISFSGELLIFYSIFYIILAALFAICMQGLFWTLDEKVPKWTLSESRIGNSPGLGFRPMPINSSQGSLVWLSSKNTTILKSYVDIIDTFLLRKCDLEKKITLNC